MFSNWTHLFHDTVCGQSVFGMKTRESEKVPVYVDGRILAFRLSIGKVIGFSSSEGAAGVGEEQDCLEPSKSRFQDTFCGFGSLCGQPKLSGLLRQCPMMQDPSFPLKYPHALSISAGKPAKRGETKVIGQMRVAVLR